MSADTLRRAAAPMRERAKAATQGQWGVGAGTTVAVDVEQHTRGSFSSTATIADLDSLTRDDYEDVEQVEADAAHIASWHPAVALAVADWLEVAARNMDDNTIIDAPESGEMQPANPEALWCDLCGGAIESPDYSEEDVVCHDWDAPLAVARAYLGEQS